MKMLIAGVAKYKLYFEVLETFCIIINPSGDITRFLLTFFSPLILEEITKDALMNQGFNKELNKLKTT